MARAVFSPTVSGMSNAGASGVPGFGSDIHGTYVPSAFRLLVAGAVLRLSVPPASTTVSMPARTPAAAVVTAARPDAQCRLCARPGTLVSPSRTATLRAMTPPPWKASATIRSSTSPAGTPERSREAATTTSASWNASMRASVPLRARPIGVRAVEMMTASLKA